MYSYVGGNPINFIDPWGLWEISAKAFAGWGVGISFGSFDSNWFVSLDYGSGRGASLSFDPYSEGPKHLQNSNPEIFSGIRQGLTKSKAAGIKFGPFGYGKGFETLSGVGFNETSNGTEGCGEEDNRAYKPFGKNKPNYFYEGPTDYLKLSPKNKWKFGVSWYVINASNTGYFWTW